MVPKVITSTTAKLIRMRQFLQLEVSDILRLQWQLFYSSLHLTVVTSIFLQKRQTHATLLLTAACHTPRICATLTNLINSNASSKLRQYKFRTTSEQSKPPRSRFHLRSVAPLELIGSRRSYLLCSLQIHSDFNGRNAI